LRVRSGDVDQEARVPLRRQRRGVDVGGPAQGLTSIAELDRDGDLVQGEVRRAELGVVVVAVLPNPAGGRLRLAEMFEREVRSPIWLAITAATRLRAPQTDSSAGGESAAAAVSSAAAATVATRCAWALRPALRNACARRKSLTAASSGSPLRSAAR
jgi:hypothetical protein